MDERWLYVQHEGAIDRVPLAGGKLETFAPLSASPVFTISLAASEERVLVLKVEEGRNGVRLIEVRRGEEPRAIALCDGFDESWRYDRVAIDGASALFRVSGDLYRTTF
jgi:hypothetical protein